MSRFAARKKPTFAKTKPAQKSAFTKFTPKEVEVEPDDEEVLNIVNRMFELGTQVYWGFIVLSKDKLVLADCKDEQYTKDSSAVIKRLHDQHVYAPIFKGFFFRNLAKAAAQICSNICYADDGGQAYTAMAGGARVDESGDWVVDRVKTDKNVVPISSSHAVDLQLFVASVDVGSTQTLVTHKGVQQTISIPAIVQKNILQGVRIDYSVKSLFYGLLCIKDKEAELTEELIKTAPWLWKMVYTAVRELQIPVSGVPIQLIYFALVQQGFEYSPYPLSLDDVLYKNYDNVPKDIVNHVSKNSIYRGGYFVNKYYFFNKGLKRSISKKVGGFFPVKWCAYNTNKDVVWERDGASLEGGNLGTTIQPPREIEEFDGMFYDPAKCIDRLRSAVGLIIPYDPLGAGIAVMESFLASRLKGKSVKDLDVKMWATFGPAPLLWIEITNDDGGDDGTTGPYSAAAAHVLWKAMGTMPLYNFSCSLNLLAARDASYSESRPISAVLAEFKKEDIPYEPIIVALHHQDVSEEDVETYSYEGAEGDVEYVVPSFDFCKMRTHHVPGRHMIDQNIMAKTANLEGKWDRYEQFGATHASKNRRDAPRKKPKREDDDTPADDPAEDHVDEAPEPMDRV